MYRRSTDIKKKTGVSFINIRKRYLRARCIDVDNTRDLSLGSQAFSNTPQDPEFIQCDNRFQRTLGVDSFPSTENRRKIGSMTKIDQLRFLYETKN